MLRAIVSIVFCLGVGTWLRAVDPVVSNVLAQQRAGTKLVDITYTLVDPDSATLIVSIAISGDGGTTWTVPCTHLAGDGIGAAVTPGTGKAIVWDAGADWNGQWSEHMRVKVVADDTPALPAGDYLVIDVSGGPSASRYPLTSLTAVPAGGWTDEYKTTRIVLRRIPGTPPHIFTMGSPTDELGRPTSGYPDETQHQVKLTQDFYIGVFEVTQKQWERVMGNWPSYFNNTSVRDARPVEQVSYDDIRGASAGAGWPGGSAVDAASLMGKLRKKTGLTTLDLPTESQWEYACRAGTTTALNNGTNLTSEYQDANVDQVGRYRYNGGSGYSPACGLANGTAKAGTYLVNAWGLYDMHGNVWERCLDWYDTYPGAVSDPRGALSGSYRVIRGGNWVNNAYYCRAACRGGSPSDNRSYNAGLRLCSAMAGGAPAAWAGTDSAVSPEFTVDTRETVATPAFSLGGGVFAGPTVSVTVTCDTVGATIHYATTGASPTEAGPTVASGGSVSVPVPGTLKARAWKAGWQLSAIAAASYTRQTDAMVDAAAVATGRGLWDLTGAYSTTVKSNSLTLSLVHDPMGRLSGTATYTVAPGTTVSMPIKGSVKGTRGSVTMKGSLKGANATKLVNVSLTLNLTVDTANHRLVGRLIGTITENGAPTPVNDDLTLAIPGDMDGTWQLHFSLDQSGRTVTGTAELTLSNDVKHTFVVRGKAGANNTAVLTLSGSPSDPVSKSITIKTTITPLEGGWARIEGFAGRGYGQVVGW
jgi:formylglycine-generating enzyme required for sulfatase activity